MGRLRPRHRRGVAGGVALGRAPDAARCVDDYAPGESRPHCHVLGTPMSDCGAAVTRGTFTITIKYFNQ